MKVIIIYDGNEESANMVDLRLHCLDAGFEVEVADNGHYED